MARAAQPNPTNDVVYADAPFLSLVIPAYNEERRLGPTVASVLAYLAARPDPSELIVVDDGSMDSTVQVARAALEVGKNSDRVKTQVISYFPNAGKGKAVRTGVLASRGRYVGFIDADLSTPVEEIDRALRYVNEAGDSERYRIVIGSRAAEGAAIGLAQPLFRRLSAKLFNVLRDALVGVRGFRDTQCGLKVFEGEVARAIFRRQQIDGFMFDVETVFIAQRMAIPTLEMGVHWSDVPDSKVRVSSGLRLLPDLWRIRRLHGNLSPRDLRIKE